MSFENNFIGPALSARIDMQRQDWTSPATRQAAQMRAQRDMGKLSANELADLGISTAELRR